MDSSGKEREAVQLMAEAEKRVKSSHSFLRGLFGGNSKVEEACEMYTRAANLFKIAKNWNAAGNAFCQAAKLHMQLQSKHDAAISFVDAGNAYKKADPQEAMNCLNAAIDIYTDLGRFTIAAKHHITIAEIYESELVDIEKAIAHYEQAADYYKGEESNSSANRCLLKVAAYAAQLEQYQKAIEIYEQVGTNTMDNPLLKYSAKEYFFKAALCHFIVDELNAKLALEKYEEMFPAFTDSRECKLVKVSRTDVKYSCPENYIIGWKIKKLHLYYLSLTIYYVDLFILFVYIRGHPHELYRTCVTGETIKIGTNYNLNESRYLRESKYYNTRSKGPVG
ncbi:beta-soluble NSF attachment protein isoform 1-T1 [Macrochelys suwanniensis]